LLLQQSESMLHSPLSSTQVPFVLAMQVPLVLSHATSQQSSSASQASPSAWHVTTSLRVPTVVVQ
jgi:hypothetical protein